MARRPGRLPAPIVGIVGLDPGPDPPRRLCAGRARTFRPGGMSTALAAIARQAGPLQSAGLASRARTPAPGVGISIPVAARSGLTPLCFGRSPRTEFESAIARQAIRSAGARPADDG